MVIIVFLTPRLAAQSDSGSDTAAFFFSKKQIVEKLERLETNPPQIKLTSWWLMCCLDKVSYICPKCGTKTCYNNPDWDWLMSLGTEKYIWNNNGYFEPAIFGKNYVNIVYNIPYCRKEIQKIKGIHVDLDESEFCESCSFSNRRPTLYLKIKIDRQFRVIKTPNISSYDIQLLANFLNDNPIFYIETHNEETSSINYIERLKELLGIEEEIK